MDGMRISYEVRTETIDVPAIAGRLEYGRDAEKKGRGDRGGRGRVKGNPCCIRNATHLGLRLIN